MTRLPPKKPSTKALGDLLETSVRTHYEALGYSVVSDVNIDGHQIDLLASKYVVGAPLFNLMIEVKSRSSDTLGVNEVTPFLNTAHMLLMNARIQSAVLVTDGRISQDAKAAVRTKSGIRLMTVEELDQDLFNYSESLLKSRYEYEAAPIFKAYIPLEGCLINVGTRYEMECDDIVSYITNWSAKNHKLLVLSGDFGSGKTTAMERVFYEQALARMDDVNIRFPVLLKLRTLRKFSNWWEFVASSLRDYQYISPPRNIFEAQLLNSKLLILLDGFDEIKTEMLERDPQRPAFLKQDLLELLEFGLAEGALDLGGLDGNGLLGQGDFFRRLGAGGVGRAGSRLDEGFLRAGFVLTHLLCHYRVPYVMRPALRSSLVHSQLAAAVKPGKYRFVAGICQG